jgi:molecular chaperone Hsp33
MEEAILAAGKEEIKDMIETDGQCEITCRYCNETHTFSKEDLEELIK